MTKETLYCIRGCGNKVTHFEKVDQSTDVVGLCNDHALRTVGRGLPRTEGETAIYCLRAGCGKLATHLEPVAGESHAYCDECTTGGAR